MERFGAMLAAHRASGGMVVVATHLPLPLSGAELALTSGADTQSHPVGRGWGGGVPNAGTALLTKVGEGE